MTKKAKVIRSDRKDLDIRGLRGLGKHLWKGVEAQEYVKALRTEWDK